MKTKNMLLYCIMVLCIIFMNFSTAQAQETDATAILKQADKSRGNASGLEWTISLQSFNKDKTDNMKLTVKAQNDNSVAIFLEPQSSKGEKMLMKKNNMWFIKPGLSKPVSISPRQKLMGDAANADIASTNYAEDYDATLTGSEAVDGVECYVMDLKGKTKKVTYDQIKYWVSKDRNLGVKAEFYSVSGKLLKTAFFKYDATIEIDGEPTPFVSEMKIADAVMKDKYTVMSYTDISVADIPASEFSLETVR